jgi:hypothetical protein
MLKKICLPADLPAKASAQAGVPLWGTKAGIVLLICVICEAERSPDERRGGLVMSGR